MPSLGVRSPWPHVCTDHMIKYTFESRSYNVAICHITMGPESVQPLVRPSNDGPTKVTKYKVSSNDFLNPRGLAVEWGAKYAHPGLKRIKRSVKFRGSDCAIV